MTPILIHRTSRRTAVVRTLLFWAVFGLITWLDSDRCVVAQQAAVVSFIVTALSYVAEAVHWAADFVVAELQIVVGYLMAAVSWVIRRVINIATATGSIFAKAWHGLGLFWHDIVKPIAQWVDAALTRMETWLRKTFEPVFRFLRRVRTYVQGIYARFFRPVLDFIDVIRQTNRVLHIFHVHLLDGLDELLTRVEQKIDETFLWVYGELNQLTDWVNRIVTVDGLFQRLALIRSLERDVAYAWRTLFNARAGALTDAERLLLRDKTRLPSPTIIASRLAVAIRSGDFRTEPDVAAATDELLAWTPPVL